MTLTFTSYRFKRWAVLIHERDNGFLYTRKFETKLQFQEEQFIIFEHPVANENWVYKTTLKKGVRREQKLFPSFHNWMEWTFKSSEFDTVARNEPLHTPLSARFAIRKKGIINLK
jgi:hypothetical protein